MCTIADAKVRQNYNCYNVYFYECLQTLRLHSETLPKRKGAGFESRTFLGYHAGLT